jgi:hypothetical protein
MRLSWSPMPPEYTFPDPTLASTWIEIPCKVADVATYLRISASGSWTPMTGSPDCGPDGLSGRAFPDDQLILADCACGALIGRFGGSSATLKAQTVDGTAGETKPFPIGVLTFVKLPDKFVGPLYVAFNLLRRPIAVASLKIDLQSGN